MKKSPLPPFAKGGTPILVCLLLLMCPFLIGAKEIPKKYPVLDKMIASVNNEAITESELNEQTQLLLVRLKHQEAGLPPMSELKKQLLDKMIMEKLQLQVASEENIAIDDDMLNKTIIDIAKRDNLTVAQLKQFLEEQGVTFEKFKKNIKSELTISKLQQTEIGQGITISRADVDHFLKSPAGMDQTGSEYHLAHILIELPDEPTPEVIQKTEKNAELIVQELKAGANFAKVAMAKSKGQQALKGGDLGWRKIAEVPSFVAKAVPMLRNGDIYGPIRESGGFHIIKLIEKRNIGSSVKMNTEAMKSKAMEILYQRKFEDHLTSWLKRLRADAEIKTYLDESA